MYTALELSRQPLGPVALVAATAVSSMLINIAPAVADADGWSIVPYIGLSQLGDQSADLTGAEDIVDGGLDIAIDSGFTAGLGVRYDYEDSRWASEFGWEYRSNDSETTAADGRVLPGGNYASNIIYVNARYALTEGNHWTPWIGGGLSWFQEIDLDSEDADGERSFSDSGSVGFQIMAGVDYDLSNRIYLTGELRYSSQSDLDLEAEGGSGRVTGIDYQPITLGLGLGFRF
jgi:opacity protein-like surface antigen